jgi:hypothetical protein
MCVIFCNAASGNLADGNARSNLTVRVSYDEGNSWSVSKTYYPGLSNYSALTILPNGNWALLAENGTAWYYDQISFTSDTLSNLTSGADSFNPQTNPPPDLHISINNAKLFISWPTSSINYVLQETIGLGATNWLSAASSNSVSITNGQALVTLPFTNSFQLFRLNHP